MGFRVSGLRNPERKAERPVEVVSQVRPDCPISIGTKKRHPRHLKGSKTSSGVPKTFRALMG